MLAAPPFRMATAGGACWLAACLLGSVLGLQAAILALPALILALYLAVRCQPAMEAAKGEDSLLAALCADAVVLHFEPGGEVGDVSDASRTILKLAPGLLLAGGLFERLHVADRVDFLCAMADMRHGAERRRVQLRLRLPGSGRETFGGFTLDLLRTGNAAWPLAGLLRDAAQARQLAEERDAMAAELAALRQEQARFIAALGHELRTPLNAVIGFSEMLTSERLGGCTDPRQLEYAGLIHGCGGHLLRLAETMLEAGRLEAGGRRSEPESLDLGETVGLCRAMLALPAGERGVRLVSRVAGGEMARLDRRIVQQVLVNLLSNAVKFTPAGGLVTIEAETGNGELRLRVTDTGPGIDESAPPRAFEAGKPEGAGIGLGLVRKLMALHGGTLQLESRPGAGTAATAAFPLGSQTLPAAPAPARAARIATLETERTRHAATRKTA